MRVLRYIATAAAELDERDPLLLTAAVLTGLVVGSLTAYGFFRVVW